MMQRPIHIQRPMGTLIHTASKRIVTQQITHMFHQIRRDNDFSITIIIVFIIQTVEVVIITTTEGIEKEHRKVLKKLVEKLKEFLISKERNFR